MITYLKNMEGWKHKDLKSKDFDYIKELFDKAFTRQKVDEDKDTTELQSLIEVIQDEEEVAIDAVPLATKVFSQMLKSFTKEDLEDLYKLVKAKYESTRLMEDLDLVLWNDCKTMFEPHVEGEIWKLQQSFLNFSQNSLRINEVFGSILLVIMELLMEKLDDFGDKYQV
ncbi:hypothetical protein Tco_0678146 [Tanacetum coccineum]|uniref:Uncharacterized protein n=1 Tax=Tanacetum coccineum TaxID=301880 RepID=A0ABQ4XFI8_9ASTR